MSLLDSIKKFLSYADHEQIAYNIILASLIGGVGVGISQASFVDDFSNVIELIIGTMLLFNEGFNPTTRGIGFVLTADGLSSLIDKVFLLGKCENCIPFDCFKIPFYELGEDPVKAFGEDPLTLAEDVLFINTKSPECRKYFDELKEYIKKHHLVHRQHYYHIISHTDPSSHSYNQTQNNEKREIAPNNENTSSLSENKPDTSLQVSEHKQNESSINSGPLHPYIPPALPNSENEYHVSENNEKESNEQKEESNDNKESDSHFSE